MSRKVWIVLVVIAVASVGVLGGSWLYVNVFSEPAPAELQLEATTGPVYDGPLDAQWAVGGGSLARYRLDEVLFGQHKTVVGQTDQVTGSTSITGGTASGTTVTVDMASVTTDDGNRDGQYRGRIMATDQFPTATFTQTVPVDVSTLPADGSKITVVLTGDLTVRGVTRKVDVGLDIQRSEQGLQAQGVIPVVFRDFGIPEPGIGGITVDDHGQIEFLVNLTPRR